MLESRHITNFCTSFTGAVGAGERLGHSTGPHHACPAAQLINCTHQLLYFLRENSQAVWTHLIWKEKPLSGIMFLIRCVEREGERQTGERRNGGQEERAQKGKHLVEMFPSPGNDEREGGWSP